VEQETACAHDKIPQERNEENGIMAILPAVARTLRPEVKKQQIRECVDYFG
jgi:hypothetical protein